MRLKLIKKLPYIVMGAMLLQTTACTGDANNVTILITGLVAAGVTILGNFFVLRSLA